MMGNMVKSKKCKKDWFMIIAIIFRMILDWSYIILSNSEHSIEFALKFSPVKMLLSYVAIIFICYETYNKKKISVFFYRIIIFFTIIPVSSVYCMRDGSSVFFFLTVLSFLYAEFIAFRIKLTGNSARTKRSLTEQPERIPDNTNKQKKEPVFSAKALSVVSALIALMVVTIMYKYNGLPKLGTLNLNNVYVVRGSYQTTWFLSGLSSLTAMVIVPFGVAKAKLRNSKTQILFWWAVQFCLFLWTGNKTWLFSIFLLLGIMVIIERGYSPNIMFLGVTAFTLLPFIFLGRGSWVYNYIFDYLNRRVLLDPAALKFFYYDYFIPEGNPIIGLSGTIFASFFPGLNEGSILNYPFIISTQYTGITSNAGTGLYGGDMANLGIAAFAIVTLLLIFFSFLIEQANRQCGAEFTMLLFTYLSFSFNDQGIFSYFLDFQGILLAVIVMIYRLKQAVPGGLEPCSKKCCGRQKIPLRGLRRMERYIP